MFNYQFVKNNYRFLLFGFILTFCSSFGQTFFIGIFNPYIREDLSLSHSEFGLIYSLATLLSSLSLIWIGKKIDDFKIIYFAIAVCLFLAFSSFFLTLVSNIILLFFAIYFLRLSGQGLMTHTASTSMAKFFDLNRGKALSISWLGLSLGEGFLPYLIIFLMKFYSWKIVWLGISIFILSLVVPSVFFILRFYKDGATEVSDIKKQEVNHTIKNWTRSEVIRDSKFYFLLPAVLGPAFLSTGIFINQIYIFESKQWSMLMLAQGFTLYAIVSVITLAVSGFLIDRFSAIKVLPFYLLPTMAAYTLVITSSWAFTPIVMMILIAMTNGTSSVLLTSTWSEIYGTKYLGGIRSITVSFFVFSTAIAPVLFGYLIDQQFTINQIFSMMLGYLILANALFLFKLKDYQPVKIA
ncbi:MAG: MFS transporter [Saprospiraceae bacterium]|nr:MFS transporter [Saprospiraceae bacterium]